MKGKNISLKNYINTVPSMKMKTSNPNKHVDALKNERIYLSNPYNFNDSYNSDFTIDIEKFKEDTKKSLEQKVIELYTDALIRKTGIDSNIVSNKEKMYKYINIDMSIMDDFLNDNQQFFHDTTLIIE